MSRAKGSAGCPPKSGTLASLRAQYDENHHKVYVDSLWAEVTRPDGPRNIAVAGNFGTGKSSILIGLTQRLKKERHDLHVELLGLSSMGADVAQERVSDAATGEVPTLTNLIQKEFVKQLLYRLDPHKTPASRYQRLRPVSRQQAAATGVILAVALGILSLLSGWPPVLFRRHTWAAPTWMPITPLSLVTLVIIGVGAAWVRQRLTRRIAIDRFTAGPAVITLDSTSSFFDKYLDEIIYYFEVSKCRIMVFEDIDRFEDPHIFETLRELNTVLNSAERLHHNSGPIRFIYAARDSIFTKLAPSGRNKPITDDDQPAGTPDLPVPTHQAMEAATYRTKFFDLIIPVVPFITHRVSRDLIGKTLNGSTSDPTSPVPDDGLASTPTVSPQLIKIVAAHIADMRLILNITNEFRIFSDRILPPRGLQGLTADALFAMVVYKNVHPADYEKIPTGTSALDHLYAAYRSLAQKAAAAANQRADVLRTYTGDDEVAAGRYVVAGKLLERQVGQLASATGRAFHQATVGGNSWEVSDFSTGRFWSAVFGSAAPRITVQLSGYGHGTTVVQWDDEEISLLLGGAEMTVDEWATRAMAEQVVEIDRLSELPSRVGRASIAELIARADIQAPMDDAEGSPDQSLATRANEVLPSALAVDLVAGGFIDRNYALYTSTYYGLSLSAKGANFLLQVVYRNDPDPTALIDTIKDVEEIISEAGPEFLTDRRGHNIHLIGHLIASRSRHLDTVLKSLSDGSTAAREFIALYLRDGSSTAEFAGRLSNVHAGNVLELIVHAITDDPAKLSMLLNRALAATDPARVYASSVDAARAIDTHAPGLPVLIEDTAQAGDNDAVEGGIEGVARVLSMTGVRFSDLTPLSRTLQSAAADADLYTITRNNLGCVAGRTSHLELDQLGDCQRVRSRMIEALPEYLSATKPDQAIADFSNLITILEELPEDTQPDAVAELLRRTPPGEVADLPSAPPATWRALATGRRVVVSVSNLDRYIQETGDLAEWVARLSDPGTSIDATDADQPERLSVALKILEYDTIGDQQRVQLVRQLQLSPPPPVADLPPVATALIPDLMSADVLDDSATTFNALPDDPTIRIAYIAQSTNLALIIPDAELTTQDISSLLDQQARNDIVDAVLERDDLVRLIQPSTAIAIANAVVEHNVEPVTPDVLAAVVSQLLNDTDRIVTLVTQQFKQMSPAQIQAVIALLPGPYTKLTEGKKHDPIYLPIQEVLHDKGLIRINRRSSHVTHLR